MTFPSRHIAVAIERPPAEVQAFVADPRNLPLWAAGLGRSVERRGGRWLAESPMGLVEVRFTPDNPHGVLDHDVTLPSGEVVRNPMRVMANGDGCEVVFSLVRRPGTGEEAFAADAAAVEADLRRLKAVLEAGGGRRRGKP